MRNKEYKDDQKVFRFINSNECLTLGCLFSFLKDNFLPVRERWVFYLLGKFNDINESVISLMEDRELFGGYFCGETYFWSIYLENERDKKEEISNEISIRNKEIRIRLKEIEEDINNLEHNIRVLDNCTKEVQINSFACEGLFINNNLKLNDLRSEYENLKNIKLDDESFRLDVQKRFAEEGYSFVSSSFENYYSMLERLAFIEYRNEEVNYRDFRSNFCEACQEAPCRCSDPD